jgi:hypothetical protein
VTTRTVEAGERSYTVEDDALIAFGALVTGSARDELTGRPPLLPARVTPSLRGVALDTPGEGLRFSVTTGAGGTFAVSGRPEVAFPDLAANPHTVDLLVDAPDYLETRVAVPVPQGTTSFPVPAGTVELRRDAVMLAGRVTTGVPTTAVANAHVELVAPVGLVGLGAALGFGHTSGTPVTAVPLTPVGPMLGLTEDAQAGTARIALERRDGLAPAEVVQLGQGGAREYATVAAVDGPSDLTRPGAVRLRTPLRFRHRASEGPARRASAGPPGSQAQLVASAFAGDRVAFVDDPTQLPDWGTVRFDDADPSRREYLILRRAEAQTGADGYYRVEAVGRAAAVTVRVTPPVGPAPPDVTHVVSYGERVNALNLRV